MTTNRLRRALAFVLAGASLALGAPAPAAVTLLGTLAGQPHFGAALASCSATVEDRAFVPHVEFVPQANPVDDYVVVFAFFDRANAPLRQVAIPAHGAAAYPLPAGADNFTCAMERVVLADGTTLPAAPPPPPHPSYVAGLVGLLGLAGLIAIIGHSSSGSAASPATAPTTSGTATPTPTAAASVTPTPSPLATPANTPVPTLRPH